MKYAFFQGCNIPIRIPQYATAARAVLGKFGIDLEIVPDFNCCGYPARNVDEKAYLLPSVRNLAIAESKGQDIAVICNCCFASLQKAKNVLGKNSALTAEFNDILAKEGLRYSGKAEVKHLLSILHEEVGTSTLKGQRTGAFNGLKVAVIHGCHVLRPREVTNFDDSFVPKITSALIETTGATSLEWRGALECCGAALAGINDDLSRRLLREKITGAQMAGAEFIVPICAYCHLQFDTTQKHMAAEIPHGTVLPVLLLPQLLGLCLGLDDRELGIAENGTMTTATLQGLKERLGPPTEEKKKKAKAAA
jgi:heterodisulfide reductase subunit B